MNQYEKPDHYSKQAKKEGYLARSVYKLLEIDERFSLFASGQHVIDLGCAPGSWSQYASRRVGKKGLVVGIDYKQVLVDSPNFICIKGNFTREHVKEKLAGHSPYDGVISDMAPDTSGDRLTDCYRSSELVMEALDFARKHLSTGGYFLAKIFQGGDEREVMEIIKSEFSRAKWVKPKAIRKKSFEIYILGTGYRGSGTGDESEPVVDTL
jgi:23S rRNA (uridine2552-2'-O)-methyltransferase